MRELVLLALSDLGCFETLDIHSGSLSFGFTLEALQKQFLGVLNHYDREWRRRYRTLNGLHEFRQTAPHFGSKALLCGKIEDFGNPAIACAE
eukprot:1951217-Amphidinium_carterae.1